MAEQMTLISEQSCTSDHIVFYTKKGQNEIAQISKKGTLQLSLLYIGNFFKQLFLPYGYPNTVSEDYLEYQIWDTAQAFCSTVTGAFTTRAILKSVGVGDAEATALSATVTWILKDGSGMIGRILFAWWKGNGLDSECKKWRLFADILNDSAMLIELILPYFNKYSMPILCITSTMKSIVGIAGGATRASITHHQAIKDNMAEISAKDGTQETLVNLIGSFTSIYLLNIFNSGPIEWIFILIMICIHLLTNYLAVKALVFKHFNNERLALVVKTYLSIGTVLGPQKTNHKESPFLGFGCNVKQFCGYNILMGESLRKPLKLWNVADLMQTLLLYKDKEYFLLVDNYKKNIYISFDKDKSLECILVAYFHAIYLGIATSIYNGNELIMMPNRKLHRATPLTRIYSFMKSYEKGNFDQNIPFHYLKELEAFVDQEYTMFVTALNINGWNLNAHCLTIGEWRVQWKNADKKEN